MTIIAANEAKQSFGKVLDAAQREPVLIQKHNRATAVILSAEEYERLRGINTAEFEAFCDRVGERAKQAGLTEKKLSDLLDNP
ncbi:prevent-host-death family protein [Terrimicrobium sacchariphilum]|uniref:Antitoxin n=1 Tax=Terrimicrobium sacchariphilum TaxID=690879 RepID=A0A146GBM8_TERSA|nr:type II toxin-antitoxin system Phd/YefM family antitoxin [Terrimicrobium sacchariphilum]GAT34790.1 prevent-host-death family protein [Terrimicrobium sacchariphilum]